MSRNYFDLFFSYSRNSLDIADQLINELEMYGIRVWFDRTDVVMGSQIKNNLKNVIEMSHEWIGMLTLMDQGYFNKDWCITELKYAIEYKVKLLPILYKFEKNEIPSTFSFLRELNIVTIRNHEDITYAINKILDCIVMNIDIVNRVHNSNSIIKMLIMSYNNYAAIDNEKIICSDNIAWYLEYLYGDLLTHNERILIRIIHNKTKLLFQHGELTYFDYKLVFRTVEKILSTIIWN